LIAGIFSEASLLGIAAFLSASGGIVSTVWSIRKGRREERDKAEEECRQRLKDARAEAEELANELYQRRMRELRDAS
jgi:hypothetical protein